MEMDSTAEYQRQAAASPSTMAVTPPQPPGGVIPVETPGVQPPSKPLATFDWKHLAFAFVAGWLVGRRRPK